MHHNAGLPPWWLPGSADWKMLTALRTDEGSAVGVRVLEDVNCAALRARGTRKMRRFEGRLIYNGPAFGLGESVLSNTQIPFLSDVIMLSEISVLLLKPREIFAQLKELVLRIAETVEHLRYFQADIGVDLEGEESFSDIRDRLDGRPSRTDCCCIHLPSPLVAANIK